MTKCGFIAIVGRPNVGKSTILNKLIHQKLAITSKKAQTTRHQILGVDTIDDKQMIFIDTPGIHTNKNDRVINTIMNKSALNSVIDANIVCWVIERTFLKPDDMLIFNKIKDLKMPVVVIINKIDMLDSKTKLFDFMPEIQKMLPNCLAIVPVSAKNNDGIDELRNLIAEHLPDGDHYFGPDEVTNRNEKFFVSEIIREKLFRLLGDELPYSTAVEIESYKLEDNGKYTIHAAIWTERQGQKKIIIGEKGVKIKQIGITARIDIEKFLGAKVNLILWVKVKSGWADNERVLHSLGYTLE